MGLYEGRCSGGFKMSEVLEAVRVLVRAVKRVWTAIVEAWNEGD